MHQRLTIILGLVALAHGAAAAAADLLRGPMLQQVTDSSAIVVFDLDEAVPAEVRFGLDGDLDLVATSDTADDDQHHEVFLDDLTADERYTYAVFGGDVMLGDEHTLWTAPADPGAPFTFLVFGDTRSDHTAHEGVMAAVAAEPLHFAVHTGDLVSHGDEATEWDTFFAIEAPLLARAPLYPVIGNHDEADGAAELYTAAFALPGNEHYYSFDYGNVHLVVLDGYVFAEMLCLNDDGQIIDSCLDDQQVQWLLDDLAATCANPDIDHTVVFNHSGPYSSKPGRSGHAQLRDLLPRLQARGVDLVLSGHDHYYERGLSNGGLPYVITGGGGAPLYDIGEPSDDPHTVITNTMQYHYVVVDVDGDTLRLTTRLSDGTEFDSTELLAGGLCVEDGGSDPPAGVYLVDDGPGCACRTSVAPLRGSTDSVAWFALGLAGAVIGAGIRLSSSRRRSG